jgi:hypothetical protein
VVDALEKFVLHLARARRLNPPEPKTIEIEPVRDETPAEAAKVIDVTKAGTGNGGSA